MMRWLLLLGTVLLASGAEDPLAARLVRCYVFVAGGSGVVISPDGLILTNHHVVDDEDELTARWADGTQVPARVVGLDPVGDLALLSAPRPGGCPGVAEIAETAALVPGMPVLAVGNPFNLGDLDDVPTLTRGVLSSGRLVRENYADAVQGDAPVNPGNSGGPLFDLRGRLLGINGQIRSRTGFRINSGIGFAIAAPQLALFLPRLQAAGGGYVRRSAAPQGLKLEDRDQGVTVIDPGASGLQVGDHVLAVAGRPAASAESARWLCTSLPWDAGLRLPIRIERSGTCQDLDMPAGRTPIPGRPYYGWRIDERPDRALILGVDGDSPAQRAGLRAGDVLLGVGEAPVGKRIDLLRALVDTEVGDQLALKLRSADGREQTVTLLVGRIR